MQAATRTRLATVHGGAAALFGISLFVILFTGTWGAASQAMHDWWQPPRKETAGATMPLNQLLPLATTHGIDLRQTRVELPQPGKAVVRFCSAQQCPLALDPVSGMRLNANPDARSAADIPVALHKNLYAGFPGRIFVSLFGIVLFVLLVGGAAMHGLKFKRAVRVRRSHGWHVRLSDLHRVVGVWAIPWLTVFSITGALSGLGALATVTLAPVAFPDQPQQVFAQLMGPSAPGATGVVWQHAPDLDGILREAARNHPDFLPQALTLHHWGDANASVEIAGITRGIPSTAVFEKHLYRASDAALLRSASARGRGFWLRVFMAVQPLHFAQYAWAPGANLWHGLHVLMGIAACVLVASGLYLWVRRHRTRQPYAARWQAGLAVGVCAGLVLSSCLLLVAGQLQRTCLWPEHWSAPLFWGVWAGVAATALGVKWHVALLRGLIAVSGLASVAAALLHAALAATQGNVSFWQADALLILFGALLLRQAWIQGSGDAAQKTFSSASSQ